MAIFTGTGGNDTLNGTAAGDSIEGLGGNDTLNGLGGDDVLDGGGGNDTLRAVTDGADLLRGGAGSDTYVIGQTIVTIEETEPFNGTDIDEVWLTGAFGSFTLAANLESLRSFATVGGTLVGNDAGNLIVGGEQNDVVVGGLGDDVLDGGIGAGLNTLDYSTNVGSGVVLALAGADPAFATGGAGTDSVYNFHHVIGSSFADTLTGDSRANALTGAGGDDSLAGLGGSDTLRGGGGNDILRGGAEGDLIEGEDGNDTLSGGTGADVLNGGDGDDILDPGAWQAIDGIDQLDGGAGTNTLSFATSTGLVQVSLADRDALVIGAHAGSTFTNFANLVGSDLLPATEDSPGDVLSGDEHDNHIKGLAGRDILRGGSGGADTLEGGEDGDEYVVDTAEDMNNVILELAGARGLDFVRTALASYTLEAANVEGLVGSNAAGQALTGNGQANIISGFDGDDVLSGLAGDDELGGGFGDDTLDGGEGDDLLYGDLGGGSGASGSGADHLLGGHGDDILRGDGGDDLLDGGTGADDMYGGLGDDHYIVDDSGDEIVEGPGQGKDIVEAGIGSATDFAQLYTLPANVENFIGTGTSGQGVYDNGLDNSFAMAGGSDLVVLTGGGEDRIDAGGGNDFVFAGDAWSAGDAVDGGAGYDSVGFIGGGAFSFAATAFTDVEQLSFYSAGAVPPPSSYSVTTHDGNVGAGKSLLVTFHSLQGTESAIFVGTAELDGNFTLLGGAGSDSLTGGSGRDYLGGNRGADTLNGGDGNDRLVGGTGGDMLTGGAGKDIFRFENVADSSTASGIDAITDFGVGGPGERIDLLAIDADSAVDGNQAFTFIGVGTVFSGAGQLRVVQTGGNWFVEGDVDGDGAADLIIQIGNGGSVPWASSDFLL
jgi:Ca2+-binding RTX toxin-like protein